jgi:pyruvate dehydrogenase E2 component (dihydrolipoamide acetyltransferase)
MQRGVIERWLPAEGDSFEVGDLLYAVETEKSTLEVEAKAPGTLTRILVSVGEEVPVGTVLGFVADPGEMLSEADIAAAMSELKAADAEEAPAELVELPLASSSATRAATRPHTGARVHATPRSRALAEKLGVDLTTVHGTGNAGTITTEDVEQASTRSANGVGYGTTRVRERRPLQGVRRTMAEVVTRSWMEIPQFVQQVSVDASGLVARRRRLASEFEASSGILLSYTDLILQAVVRAVAEVPEANASFATDELILYEDVNLSVAIASEAGLLVPVIHRAQELSLSELAIHLRDLSERAHTGPLRREDVEGGTITVSNLGMFGVETGMPLVTVPQVAIVFAGAIVDRPVAVGGAVEIRPILGLALAYDHRAIDGVTGARFTTALKRILEFDS